MSLAWPLVGVKSWLLGLLQHHIALLSLPLTLPAALLRPQPSLLLRPPPPPLCTHLRLVSASLAAPLPLPPPVRLHHSLRRHQAFVLVLRTTLHHLSFRAPLRPGLRSPAAHHIAQMSCASVAQSLVVAAQWAPPARASLALLDTISMSPPPTRALTLPRY